MAKEEISNMETDKPQVSQTKKDKSISNAFKKGMAYFSGPFRGTTCFLQEYSIQTHTLCALFI